MSGLLLLLLGCGRGVELEVTVVDLWSQPITGATVVLDGSEVQRATTGGDGKATLEVEPGDVRVVVGKDGYIKEAHTITVLTNNDGAREVDFQLYPAPPRNGFYGVGATALVPADQVAVSVVATELSEVHGIKASPRGAMPRDATRFVYRSGLRAEQIRQMDVRLSKLTFRDSTEAVGALGPTTVQLNLWVTERDVPYKVKSLNAPDHFLVVSEPLSAGVYAFHAQNILDGGNTAALDELPEELRVAYLFEVKP